MSDRVQGLKALSLPEKLRRATDHAIWTIKLAWSYEPRLLVMLVIVSILQSAVPAGQALVARGLINATIRAVESEQTGPVVPWLLAGAGVMIFQQTFTIGKSYLQRRFRDEVQVKITLAVFDHAARLDIWNFEDPASQDVMERAQHTIALHTAYFIEKILTLFTQALQLVSLVLILLVIVPLATLVLIPITLPYILYDWMMARANYSLQYDRATERRWTTYYTSTLTSNNMVTEVRLLNLAPLLIERYRALITRFKDEDRRIYSRKFLGEYIFSVVFFLLFYAIFAWVIWRAIQGAITVGDTVIYGRAAYQLRTLLGGVSHAFTDMVEETLYVADLRHFFSLETAEQRDTIPDPAGSRGEIIIHDLSFTYPGSSQQALSDISLHIKPGQIVALVGENGAGKTTLVKLIGGLYAPNSGAIFLDNHNIADLSFDYLHRHMAFVMQQFNQYEATAADNIAYGDWERLLNDREEIIKIAHEAGVESMVSEMPQAYDTQLGRSFGTYTLSGGQWQRIAIARAFARRSASVLILDEPTSNLDAIAEAQLFDRLRDLTQGRTTILISHRFTSLKMADHIIVLDAGRIVQQGAHHQLIEQKGKYTQLYNAYQQRALLPS